MSSRVFVKEVAAASNGIMFAFIAKFKTSAVNTVRNTGSVELIAIPRSVGIVAVTRLNSPRRRSRRRFRTRHSR
eukprot:10713006-Prorocentrum_lima.AAC.1